MARVTWQACDGDGNASEGEFEIDDAELEAANRVLADALERDGWIEERVTLADALTKGPTPMQTQQLHDEGACDVCDVLRASGNAELEVEPHPPSDFITATVPEFGEDEVNQQRFKQTRARLIDFHAKKLDEPDPDAARFAEHEGADGGDNEVLRLYFDRFGYEIDRDTWLAIMDEGEEARRIGKPRRVRGCVVSTIFTATNRNTDPHGEPWIFETLVLRDGEIVGARYYTTEEAARRGHVVACGLTLLGFYR